MTLLEQVMTLPLPQRRELCLKVLDSCSEPPVEKDSRPRFLIERVCAAMGLEALPETHDYTTNMMRMFLAYQMHLEGFTDVEVGQALTRDRATIWYYLKRMKDMMEYPISFKKEMILITKFQKAIHDETDNRTI